MRIPCGSLAVLLAALLAATFAQAQTTGDIKGEVEDESREPIVGALVTVRGPSLQGERATNSDRSGRFHVPLLPPGPYAVKISMPGYQTTELADVLVSLGGSRGVKVTLVKGNEVETITVNAPPPPLIDPSATDNVVNIDLGTLDNIPTATRTYAEMTRYVPSITGNDVDATTGRAGGLPSIRGEGQYGDNYLIDGLTVREPYDKSTATPLPFDVIDEVQIVTDGFSPEYGQALGGTINVITRTGSNSLDGEVAYLYTSDSLTADYDETFLATPSEFDRGSPYVNLGGPILKNRLWYFLSYNRDDSENNFASTEIPGFGTLEEGSVEDESNTYFGKATWSITPNHSVSLNVTYRDRETIGLGADTATAEARSGLDISDDRWRMNYHAVLNPNNVLELRLGRVRRDTLTVPVGSLGPAQYEISSFGVTSNNAFQLQQVNVDRKDAALVYTRYWNPGGRLGSHELKGGFEYHEPTQTSGSTWTGLDEDVFSVSPASAPDPGQPDRFNGGTKYSFRAVDVMGQTILVPTVLNEYVLVPPLENRNEEMGFFIQDRWELGRVNMLLGLRWDRAKGYNDENTVFFEYDWDRSIAPRFSLSWDVTGDGVNVVKTGWGRFYDTSSTRFGEFANTQISFAFRSYGWSGGDTEDFRSHIDDGGAFDIHDPGNWVFDLEQSNTASPSNYSDVYRPARADRFLLEYNRRLWDRYAVKVRYVHSESRNLIEDIFEFPGFVVGNTPYKRRDYDSYELEFNGRPTANITFNASWVHSKAKGTNPGQFETAGYLTPLGSAYEIGVFLDRPEPNPPQWCGVFDDPMTPGTECVPSSWAGDPTVDFNDDGLVNEVDYDLFFQNLLGGLGSTDGNLEGWYGYLPYSIDDQVKLQGRIYVPKWHDVYFSGFLQWASGYHTERQGFQQAYGAYLTFSDVPILGTSCSDPNNPTFATCVPNSTKTPVSGQRFAQEDGLRRGTLENPSYWSLDLSIGKRWNLPKGMGIEGRAEIFNVFNEQNALSISDTAVSTFGEPLTRQQPRSARLFVRVSF